MPELTNEEVNASVLFLMLQSNAKHDIQVTKKDRINKILQNFQK